LNKSPNDNLDTSFLLETWLQKIFRIKYLKREKA
jgi:hypothetical protein